MPQIYEVTGELTDNRTLKLDEPLPEAVGRVRVTLELVPTQTKSDLTEFMKRLWEEQRGRGHAPPTKRDVDAYLKEERDSWES